MRFFWLLQIAVILILPAALYGWRHRFDARVAMRGAAAVLAGTYTLLFGMFAVGEVFADPGGWSAVAATAAWVVPIVVLGLLAWLRPDLAITVPAAVVGGLYLLASALGTTAPRPGAAGRLRPKTP